MSLIDVSDRCLWSMSLIDVSDPCLWSMSLIDVSDQCHWSMALFVSVLVFLFLGGQSVHAKKDERLRTADFDPLSHLLLYLSTNGPQHVHLITSLLLLLIICTHSRDQRTPFDLPRSHSYFYKCWSTSKHSLLVNTWWWQTQIHPPSYPVKLCLCLMGLFVFVFVIV